LNTGWWWVKEVGSRVRVRVRVRLKVSVSVRLRLLSKIALHYPEL